MFPGAIAVAAFKSELLTENTATSDGVSQTGSSDIVDVKQCPILVPQLEHCCPKSGHAWAAYKLCAILVC